jgi:4'-phosphopantetheinyl transferase
MTHGTTFPPSSGGPPPEPVPPLRDEAHVWSASLDIDGQGVRRLEDALSFDERERADRLATPGHRRRWIAARGILRSILSSYMRISPEKIRFSYSDRGKPLLADPDERTALRFSLSHCENRALVAVIQGREIGVDIERIRENRFDAAVARRFFTPDEQALLRSTPPAEWPAAFFAIWTRKEACVKASGLGLALPLRSFDVSGEATTPRLIVARNDLAAHTAWTVVDVETAPGYAAACAAEGRGLTILRREFRL